MIELETEVKKNARKKYNDQYKIYIKDEQIKKHDIGFKEIICYIGDFSFPSTITYIKRMRTDGSLYISGVICIPIRVVSALNLSEGDKVKIKIKKEGKNDTEE